LSPAPPRTGNLFEAVPDRLDHELFEDLAQGRGVRIIRIVSTGQCDPADVWQDADDDEWVVLLTGRARLLFEKDSRMLEMEPGDWCHIPAHTRHRVDFTDPDQPSVWIAVHFEG